MSDLLILCMLATIATVGCYTIVLITAHRKFRGTRTIDAVIGVTLAAGITVSSLIVGGLWIWPRFLARNNWGIALLVFLIGFIPSIFRIVMTQLDLTPNDLEHFGRPPSTADKSIKIPLCQLSYWSLILIPVSIIGLPVAIVAIHKIRASNGTLSGLTIAKAGLWINAMLLAFSIINLLIILTKD